MSKSYSDCGGGRGRRAGGGAGWGGPVWSAHTITITYRVTKLTTFAHFDNKNGKDHIMTLYRWDAFWFQTEIFLTNTLHSPSDQEESESISSISFTHKV